MSDMAPPPAPAAPAGGPSSNSKLIALIGWIVAPWGIIAIFLDDYKNDMFIRSHVIQAVGVFIVAMIVSAVSFGFLWIVVFIYQIYCGVQAYNGKEVQVPVIYGLVKKYIEQTS